MEYVVADELSRTLEKSEDTKITKDYSYEKISVQRNMRISQKIAAEQDRDDTIKKALYQLVLLNKVLVMRFQEVSSRLTIRNGTLYFQTRILLSHNLRLITTEAGHNQNYLGQATTVVFLRKHFFLARMSRDVNVICGKIRNTTIMGASDVSHGIGGKWRNPWWCNRNGHRNTPMEQQSWRQLSLVSPNGLPIHRLCEDTADIGPDD